MSEAGIEVVRRAIAAYNQRNLEALRALNHPDVRVDWSASRGLEAGVYTGLAEAIEFFETFFQTFEQGWVEADEFIESGDLILVPNTFHARGRHGIETAARSTLVFEVRGGQIVSMCLYQANPEALQARRPSATA